MTTTPTTTPKPRRRWLQFSLRTMLIVATLVALATHAGRQWWVTRLVYLVEKQDCFIDEQRYAEAEAVAELAWRLYPIPPGRKAHGTVIKVLPPFREPHRRS